MRSYLGVGASSPVASLYGDMGWMPGDYRRKIEVIRLWVRLQGLPNTRLTKRLFLNDHLWNKRAKSVFKEAGLSHIFESGNAQKINIKVIVDQAKLKLKSSVLVSWRCHCLNKPKLRTYCTYKHDYNTEPHVLLNIPHKYRSVIARLRNGTLPLRIETGRYVNLEVEERKCILCTDNVVEDELHFIFDCRLYDDIQSRFMNMSTDLLPNGKLSHFFSSNHVKTFSKHIYEMFIRRRNVTSIA